MEVIVSSKTQKETIEYDAKFLREWNTFCDTKGYTKRKAAHASRFAFMNMLTAEQLEHVMLLADTVRSRQSHQRK